jgi:hypothetical protein
VAEIGGTVDTVTIVRLPGWSDPVQRAGRWLRSQLNIADYESCESEFAEYFRCRVVPNEDWNHRDHRAVFVEFDSEPEATLFLLRWA